MEAILSLGSNLGERLLFLNTAIHALRGVPEVEIIKISSCYETKPWGVSDSQNKYLNCCVKLKTNLNAFELLGVCLGIEAAIGRKRAYRFAPRTIDIDLIAYEGVSVNSENLVLPHPRFKERAFVLIPFQEVCPGFSFWGLDFKSDFDKCEKQGVFKTNYNFM